MVPETITFTDIISDNNLLDDSNIIHISPSPTTQAKYTIKLSQSGFDLFSGAARKQMERDSILIGIDLLYILLGLWEREIYE